MKDNWHIDSWRKLPIKQQPEYGDMHQVAETEALLRTYPPLILPEECRNLRQELAMAAEGQAFLLQGGDCAESFAEFNQHNLRRFFQTILQMTVALMYGAGYPVVKVGRIAGQFAKPRSAGTEKQGDVELPSYRGDIANAMEFAEQARQTDPGRMLKAYHQSAATLNFLRALAKCGYASLDHISDWNVDFVRQSPQGKRFQDIVDNINDCLNFIKASKLPVDDIEQLREADFYTSHEALILGYEEALSRLDEETGEWYGCSAHMLWIGDRTRALDEAHVEYMRGIANPIGCKVGPSMEIDGLLKLTEVLNPENIPGRLTLITRMGAEKVGDLLPPLVRAVKEAGRNVVWSCDPMHGNTFKAPNGIKTRKFVDILSELRQFFQIHQAEGTYAGGVHFEMTGQDVTECLGGAQAISELDLRERYHTHCDPRLNSSQSLELAFLIAEELRKNQG